MRETTPTDPKAKEGEMFFSRVLGGLWDEARHGQKTKKFSYHFAKIRIFLGAAVDEKTAAQKHEKSQNFVYLQVLTLTYTKPERA
jgi:hypothetical protein